MKIPIPPIVTAAIIVATAILATSSPLHNSASAAGGAQPEAYRAMSILSAPNSYKSPEQIQSDLNEAATEGWRVRTATPNAIILYK